MSLKRYAQLPHLQITPSGGPSSIVDQALAARGLERRVAVRVESFLMAPLIVASSDLVLTAPRMVFDSAGVSARVTLFRPPLSLAPLALHLYWDSRRTEEAKLAWFCSELEAVGKEHETPSQSGPLISPQLNKR